MINEVSKICITILFSFIVIYIIELCKKNPVEYEEKLAKSIEKEEIKKIRTK